jgi:CheY-like chemotaxis protein
MTLPRPGGSLRVLVVTDNAADTDAMTRLLRLQGYHAAVASDGVQAVAVARAFHPHVVMLDVDPVDRDAVAAAAKLRATTLGPAPIIMAVAGLPGADLSTRLSGSQIAGVWAKPVDGKSVLGFLAELQAVLDAAGA